MNMGPHKISTKMLISSKKKRLLMILQAYDIEYDSRLLKECNTLLKYGIDVNILYFHADNKQTLHGKLSTGITFVRKQLLTRKYFKSGRFLILKLLEQWIYSAFFVTKEKPDIVCVHDERFFGLVPILLFFKKIGIIKRILLDQRELPVDFLNKGRILLLTLKLVIKCCDGVAMANKERLKLLADEVRIKEEDLKKYFPICNYPDNTFINIPVKKLPDKIHNWLQNSDYVYAQCPSEPERYLYNLVEAIMHIDPLKLLITGQYQERDYNYLRNKYGDNFEKKVLFVGAVDPYELPIYIDHALCSVVFYDTKSLNRVLCAPNRLYQSLARGVPVVVGNNLSMKRIVEETGAGIVIDSDGRTVDSIERGLVRALKEIKDIKNRAEKCRHKYIWEAQERTVISFFLGRSLCY